MSTFYLEKDSLVDFQYIGTVSSSGVVVYYGVSFLVDGVSIADHTGLLANTTGTQQITGRTIAKISKGWHHVSAAHRTNGGACISELITGLSLMRQLNVNVLPLKQ